MREKFYTGLHGSDRSFPNIVVNKIASVGARLAAPEMQGRVYSAPTIKACSYRRGATLSQLFLLVIVIFILAACGGDQEEKPQPSAMPLSPTPELFMTPTLAFEDREQAERHFEQLRQLHTEIAPVWENLAKGQQSQCGADYNILAPEAITGDHALEIELQRIAIDLQNAVLLWEAECQKTRTQIPQDVIDRGLLMVRTAGDNLSEVEKMLENAS